MRKILALTLVMLMILALSACSVESSSTTTTTVTTTTTDSEGHTTTNTVTNQTGVSAGTDGVSVSSETTEESTGDPAEEEEPEAAEEPAATTEEAVEAMAEAIRSEYTDFTKGTNEDGDQFIYLWGEDYEDGTYPGALVIVYTDGEVAGRQGVVTPMEDYLELYDESKDSAIPFHYTSTDENNEFDLIFDGDGDVAHMHFVDADEVIADLTAIMQAAA